MPSIQMIGWPVVTVSFRRPATDQDVQQWLAELTVLLEKQQPFSMVVEARPDSRFSPEARKTFGLWFKDYRALLGDYCCGVARIVESAEEGERVVSDNMKKAMPFPMMAMTESDQARDWAVKMQRKKEITV
ncbi:MAG: hypothetical protein ACR2PT_20370 [Endozoicomonas sp.]